MRGEWLAPVLDLEEGVEVVEDGDALEQDKVMGEGEGEGWQDIDEYQREQSVEGPEVATEELGVDDDGDVEETAVVDDEDEDRDVGVKKSEDAIKPLKKVRDAKVKKAIDPDQRKKDKKERHKAEKKAKEEARQRAAQTA